MAQEKVFAAISNIDGLTSWRSDLKAVEQLKPSGTGTELTIAEDGEVYNPIFRVMQKFFFSPYRTIDTYQADLREHLQG